MVKMEADRVKDLPRVVRANSSQKISFLLLLLSIFDLKKTNHFLLLFFLLAFVIFQEARGHNRRTINRDDNF